MCIIHKGFRGIRAVLPASILGGNLIGLKPAIPYEIIRVPRSSDRHNSNLYSLHAVFEMVEPTHQSHFKGGGFKPPKGAVVKSYGSERLGNGPVKNRIRYR